MDSYDNGLQFAYLLFSLASNISDASHSTYTKYGIVKQLNTYTMFINFNITIK